MTAGAFPPVEGKNLEGRRFVLPRDFEGDLNIVFVAFRRKQQADVDTWAPAVRALEATSPRVRAYELPTIARLGRLSQAWINTAMRLGVADRHARRQTITLYLDKEPFRHALGVPNEDEIEVLLLDRNGVVLWHKRGRCDEEGARELEAVVQRAIAG